MGRIGITFRCCFVDVDLTRLPYAPRWKSQARRQFGKRGGHGAFRRSTLPVSKIDGTPAQFLKVCCREEMGPRSQLKGDDARHQERAIKLASGARLRREKKTGC